MDQLTKLGPLAALSRIWNELSPPQRVVVTAFAAVAIVSTIFIAMAASKPRMAVLFSRLESEDAGAIVQKLSERKVPYKISADGSTVEVPENTVHDLRLDLATQGLPQGGSVGFELFDKSSFGMTEFTERLNYQRAIQGELTRTISQLAPVSGARVHIAIPDDKVFQSEQEPVTASVVLTLSRGMPLSDEQVGGIVHLVASAVEKLKPANVTVVDSHGNVLSEGRTGTAAGGLLTGNQSKLKRQFETDLAHNLQTMVARIVGADKAVVRVSAELSFDQKQTKSETYEPASQSTEGSRGVLLSETTSNENYNGGVMPPGTAPSSETRGSAGKDSYTRSETKSQYEVTRRIEETVSAPGQVKRLSVAVLVDEKVLASQSSAIREAVAAAAGIDLERGDQITVQRVKFDNISEKEAAAQVAKASRTELIGTIAKNAGAVILLLVFLFFLRSIVKQIKIQALPAPEPDPAFIPAAQAARQAEQAFPMVDEPPPPPPEPRRQPRPAFAIPPEISESDPEELAGLVRSWMSEK